MATLKDDFVWSADDKAVVLPRLPADIIVKILCLTVICAISDFEQCILFSDFYTYSHEFRWWMMDKCIWRLARDRLHMQWRLTQKRVTKKPGRDCIKTRYILQISAQAFRNYIKC